MFGLWDMVIVAIVAPFVYKAYVYSNRVCDEYNDDSKHIKPNGDFVINKDCQGKCNECKCNK